jgi:hypothetical protein
MTTTPREPTLKPCPFCGSSNIDPAGWMDGDGNAGPACDDCGASAGSVDAWNRRVTPATAGEDAIWLSPELNYGEQPAPASRDEGADELQRLRERVRTLEADARRLPVREFKGTDDPDTTGWTYPVEFLDAVKSAMPADDFAPSLEGIELALIGYERVIGRGLELPSISAEAAPKCETCDEGMARCTKPGCPCGGDGCDPCPDCEKGEAPNRTSSRARTSRPPPAVGPEANG